MEVSKKCPETPKTKQMLPDSLNSVLVVSSRKIKYVAPAIEKPRPIKMPVSKKKSESSGHKGYQLQAWKFKVQNKPLPQALTTATKSIMTKDWQIAREEHRMLSVLQRVDQLKQDNLWSFRQIKPHTPPQRKKTQWDLVLEEVLWLSEDFYQERQWKMAMAARFAYLCQEWHLTNDKSTLCGMRDTERAATGITLFPDDNMYLVRHDFQQDGVLSHLPTLSTPKVDPEVFYTDPNQLKITPVSKYQVTKTQVVPDAKWDEWMRPVESQPPSDTVKWLGTNRKYNTQADLGLFHEAPPAEEPTISPQDVLVQREVEKPDELLTKVSLTQTGSIIIKTNPSQSPKKELDIRQPTIAKTLTNPNMLEWSSDEDDALWSLANYYNQNWAIVSESLRMMPIGTAPMRNQWECFERFSTLAKQDFKPSSKAEFLYSASFKSSKTTIGDNKTKAMSFLGTFDTIRKLAKKRDAQRPPSSKPPITQVNVTAHETHEQIQTQAGIDITAPPLGPAELSAIKEKRMLLEQQRNTFLVNSMRPQVQQVRPQPVQQPGMRPMMRPAQAMPIRAGMVVNTGGSPMAAVNQAAPLMRVPSGQTTFTPEQLQALMMNRTQIQARPEGLPPGSVPQRMQADATTAAAFVALSNGQQAAKSMSSIQSVDTPKKPKQDESENSSEEVSHTRRRRKTSISPSSSTGSSPEKKPARKSRARPPPKNKKSKKKEEIESASDMPSDNHIESDLPSDDSELKKAPKKKATRARKR
ncbi:hypothetical protein EDD86DRAFT_203177 [Gorgonomyces haynaldii]|nr:hypothetical protein EDD86DRAFT_203177 [Gorgonomyces haynaldii]